MLALEWPADLSSADTAAQWGFCCSGDFISHFQQPSRVSDRVEAALKALTNVTD